MNDFTVYLENESGTRLQPFSVEEGARRIPRLADAAGLVVVDGELHMRHCGAESAEVRILRSGRERAVRPGQSYRVLPGDTLCVANREVRVREVYRQERQERPKRRSFGTAARSIALGAAAAAAMLAGCNTDANRAGSQTAPVAAETPAVANENPTIKKENPPVAAGADAVDVKRLEGAPKVAPVAEGKPPVAAGADAVDVKPWAGKPGPEWSAIANCANDAKSAQDKARCCMDLAKTDDVAKKCCDWVRTLDPSVFCDVDVNRLEGEEIPEPDPVAECLAKPGSAQDKARCCMELSLEDDKKACCDALHKADPSVYCRVEDDRTAGKKVPSKK